MAFKKWFLCQNPRPQAKLRMLCLPYAGGGASVYNKWGQHLPEDVEVIVLQLPGRESRITEDPVRNFQTLIAKLLPLMGPLTTKPLVLFGHSLGGLLAFELARSLSRRGILIKTLIISGTCCPETFRFPNGTTTRQATARAITPSRHLAALINRFGYFGNLWSCPRWTKNLTRDFMGLALQAFTYPLSFQ